MLILWIWFSWVTIDFCVNIITEHKKLAEEKQTKVDVIQEEDSTGVIEVHVPEQYSPEK